MKTPLIILAAAVLSFNLRAQAATAGTPTNSPVVNASEGHQAGADRAKALVAQVQELQKQTQADTQLALSTDANSPSSTLQR